MFPVDDIWNTAVGTLATDPMSDAYVRSIGASRSMHADFGSGLWEGEAIGIPFVVVPSGQAPAAVSFGVDDESDPGPYPVPDDAPVEGGSDHHVLVLRQGDCKLFELFDASILGPATWSAYAGAVFDLIGHALRPDGWTSADAAGLPILPGLVRYDEVEAGEIRHALRFTAPRTRSAYVWPARHQASSDANPALPPMGQRFRLRGDFDASAMSPEAQVIVRALQVYGMMLADNGSAWFLSGAPDERWDNDALRDLGKIHGSDFEAVDVSSLQLEPGSSEVRR